MSVPVEAAPIPARKEAVSPRLPRRGEVLFQPVIQVARGLRDGIMVGAAVALVARELTPDSRASRAARDALAASDEVADQLLGRKKEGKGYDRTNELLDRVIEQAGSGDTKGAQETIRKL